MLYLLDANVLIRAHEDYYGIEQVPQFWEWLIEVGIAGQVKMPFEIQQEIAVSDDPLGTWIRQAEVAKALVLDEDVDADLLNYVLTRGYAPDLTDSELEKIGRDPFLIAYALASQDRVVVTKEVSSPKKQRANRKVPDVCDAFDVKRMKDFDMFKLLKFSTK